MSKWIPDDDWETIVRNIPIVSVDIVVECKEGVVLAKRLNEPAKGQWFVPGGRVQKNEKLVEAVQRIAKEELKADVEIKEYLGVFEHFYDSSDIGDQKHYVAHGFHVHTDRKEFQTDSQHDDIKIVNKKSRDFHRYVNAYLDEMTSN